ncbi:metallophosphoesterase family protein [Alkalicoccus urumqiensis]|uniref:metallophosphoesterase family protein n=1 Tax=Alkalicoccus urumqiensis TaxID=1548213 RepID=UPI0015E5D6A7|nr:DNA repair exonuclease [Alkalicoccus urumqiensis]
MITFLHAADLHLDRPQSLPAGLTPAEEEYIQQTAERALHALVREAAAREVDFVLVSGDLYHYEKRSLHAQWQFHQACLELEKVNIPVYVIHGNHDPETGAQRMELPGNVSVFSSEGGMYQLNVRGQNVHLYGFSYPEKAYVEEPYSFYEKSGEDGFHIAMLHGQEKGQSGHDPYAPFSTSVLKQTGMDYWALGHIHKPLVLSEDPPIIYSGSLTGAVRSETGPRGAYYVTLTPSEPAEWEFVPLADVERVHAALSLDGIHTWNQLSTSIEKMLEQQRRCILSVTISGSGPLSGEVTEERLREWIKPSLEQDGHWLDSVRLEAPPPAGSVDPEVESDIEEAAGWFLTGGVQVLEEEVQQSSMLRKHFSGFSEEEWEHITEEAAQSLKRKAAEYDR